MRLVLDEFTLTEPNIRQLRILIEKAPYRRYALDTHPLTRL